jgi:DNA-binding transcriptional ArsR family regulator
MKLSNNDFKVQQKIFEMQCEICKSLGHPLRLQIVDHLNQEEASASSLIEILGISKGNLSKHMSMLIHGGIVEYRREGRQIVYRLTDPEIHKACAIMRSILYRRLKQGGNLALAIEPAKAN